MGDESKYHGPRYLWVPHGGQEIRWTKGTQPQPSKSKGMPLGQIRAVRVGKPAKLAKKELKSSACRGRGPCFLPPCPSLTHGTCSRRSGRGVLHPRPRPGQELAGRARLRQRPAQAVGRRTAGAAWVGWRRRWPRVASPLSLPAAEAAAFHVTRAPASAHRRGPAPAYSCCAGRPSALHKSVRTSTSCGRGTGDGNSG